eukprot:jgi/Chrzof1/15125/Cz09g28040.t1
MSIVPEWSLLPPRPSRCWWRAFSAAKQALRAGLQPLQQAHPAQGVAERHFPAAATVQQQEPNTPLVEAAVDVNEAAATVQQAEPSVSPLVEAATNGSIVDDPLPVTTVPQEPPTSPLVPTATNGSIVDDLTARLREVTGWWQEEKCHRTVVEEAASEFQLQLAAVEQELAAMRQQMLQLEAQATAMVTPASTPTPHLLHTTLLAVADDTTTHAVPAAAATAAATAGGEGAAGEGAAGKDASDAEGVAHDAMASSRDGQSGDEESPSQQQQQQQQEEQQQQEQHAPAVVRWDTASEAHARHAAGLAAGADKVESAEQNDVQSQQLQHPHQEQQQAATPAAAAVPATTIGASIIATAVGVAGCSALVAVAAAACGPALAYTSIKWLFWGSTQKNQAS